MKAAPAEGKPPTWFQRYLYRNYRSYYGMKHKFRRRFTRAGMLVLVGTLSALLLGVDTNLSMAYQAFTFLLALLFTAMLLSRIARPQFAVQRVLPRLGSPGVMLNYRVRIRNRTKRHMRGLLMLDELADPRPSFEEFSRAREPGEEKRNWLDRHYAYYRWMWLLEKNERGEVKEQMTPNIPPQGEAEVDVQLKPLRRGILHFTGVSMLCPDPFGLYCVTVNQPLPESVLILPNRYAIPRFALPGAMKYQQGGVAMAAAIGESEEFISLRDYRPGDPRKHIHWKSWAKMGRPIVKEFQDEFFVRHALILDTFSEIAYSDLFEEAVSVAASFACTIQAHESLLDLMFVGPKAYCFTAGRGLAHTDQMLEILASVNVCLDKPFSLLENAVVEHASVVSGCICILLAWDMNRQRLIERLRLLGVPLLVFVIIERGSTEKLEPGPMSHEPENFHVLEVGKVAEALLAL